MQQPFKPAYVGPTADPRLQPSASHSRLAGSNGSQSPVLSANGPLVANPITGEPVLSAQQAAAARGEMKTALKELAKVLELRGEEVDLEALPALDFLEDNQGREMREAYEKVQRDKAEVRTRQLEEHYSSLAAKSVDLVAGLLAPKLELAVERRVDIASDQLKAVVGNLQSILDRERNSLQPFNYASASTANSSSSSSTAVTSASGFRDRDGLNASVATLASELQAAIDSTKSTRYRNRALVDSSVVAKIEGLVDARVQEVVARREAEIERRVREDVMREVREAENARDARMEDRMEERFARFERERRVEGEAGRVQAQVPVEVVAKPATPQPTPQAETNTTVVQALVHDHFEKALGTVILPMMERITTLENTLATLQATQLSIRQPTPQRTLAPSASTSAANRSPVDEEDVKPRINSPTHAAETAELRQRVRELERRLGFDAIDVRDVDKPAEDRILPPGRTVADVLDESQIIMGEVVDTVNGELRALEDRIVALEQGVGGQVVAAEMDTAEY